MAPSTELLLIGFGIDPVDWQVLAVCVRGHMTINTTRKAVIGVTYSLMNRDIPLMFDELKMFATHQSGRGHAGIKFRGLAAFNYGVLPVATGQCPGTDNKRCHQDHSGYCFQHLCVLCWLR